MIVGVTVGQILAACTLDAVYPVDASNPIAIDITTRSILHVRLSPGKIPHKIPEVHVSELIREEEPQVLPECRTVGLVVESTPLLVNLNVAVGIGIHPREEALILLVVLVLGRRLLDFQVLAIVRDVSVLVFAAHHVSREVRAVEERIVAILLAVEVAQEAETVARLVFVDGRIAKRADYRHCKRHIAQHYHKHRQSNGISQNLAVFKRPPRPISEAAHQQQYKSDDARIIRQTESIDEKQIEIRADINGLRYNEIQHYRQYHHRQRQSQQNALGILAVILSIIIHKHNCWYHEQIEQVNTDAQTHQISDEDKPTVGIRLVGVFLPTENQPKYNRRKEATHTINLRLHSRKPRRVAECINQAAHNAARNDADSLASTIRRHTLALIIPALHNPAGNVSDAPEKEQRRKSGCKHCRTVHHQRHTCVVGREQRCHPTNNHPQGCSRGVSHLQLDCRSNKFAAVPPTCGRLHGQEVTDKGNSKRAPSRNPVIKLEFVHLIMRFYLFRRQN